MHCVYKISGTAISLFKIQVFAWQKRESVVSWQVCISCQQMDFPFMGKKKQQSHTKLFYRKVCYYFKWIKTFYSDNLKVLTQRQTLMSPFKIKKSTFLMSFFWLKKKNHHSKLLIFPDILFFFMDQKLSVSWPFYSPLFIF